MSCSMAGFQGSAASELGRGRYRKRPTRRALGRHPGRGDARVFEERAAHVREQIPRLTAAAKQTRNPDTLMVFGQITFWRCRNANDRAHRTSRHTSERVSL